MDLPPAFAQSMILSTEKPPSEGLKRSAWLQDIGVVSVNRKKQPPDFVFGDANISFRNLSRDLLALTYVCYVQYVVRDSTGKSIQQSKTSILSG